VENQGEKNFGEKKTENQIMEKNRHYKSKREYKCGGGGLI